MSRLRSARVATLAVMLLSARSAFAEATAQDKAAAEALFRSGAELMEGQRFAEACQKFDASNTLDPAVGTRLRLADCYDRVGRTASAWALFLEVAAAARTQGQTDRENVATVRAADLEARLSVVLVRVDLGTAPSELSVVLGGISVPRASWNTRIPVDPGKKRVEVGAPAHASWSTDVVVPSGSSVSTVDVPELRPLPAPRVAPNPASAERPSGGVDALTLGAYASTGAGVVGLGVAAFLAYRAHTLNDDSLEHCSSADANACTERGKELRDEALDYATASTATAIAGAALLATGVTLFLLAPGGEPQKAAVPVLRLRASVADGARIQLEGTWF